MSVDLDSYGYGITQVTLTAQANNLDNGVTTITRNYTITKIETVNGPTLILSQGAQTIYNSISPSTVQGADSLTALFGSINPNLTRAFAYDPDSSSYVEFPLSSRSGLQKTRGIFLATRVPLNFSLNGTATDLDTSITVESDGWTFACFPLMKSSSGVVLHSVAWNDLEFYRSDDSYLSGQSLIDAMGTVGSNDINTARPWYWNGTSYGQVDTLHVGRAYWFKNNDPSHNITLTYYDPSSFVNSLAVTASLTRSTGTVVKYRDQGQPPPPPSSTSAESSSGSSCGAGAGIASLLMAFLFMSLRLRSIKP
jgi:hypothetical protein